MTLVERATCLRAAGNGCGVEKSRPIRNDPQFVVRLFVRVVTPFFWDWHPRFGGGR